MSETNGNGNGNGNAWDNGFWRFARIVGMVVAVLAFLTAWFPSKADVKETGDKFVSLKSSVDSLRVDVRSLARSTMTKAEAKRLLDEANEVWKDEAEVHGRKFRPLRMNEG